MTPLTNLVFAISTEALVEEDTGKFLLPEVLLSDFVPVPETVFPMGQKSE